MFLDLFFPLYLKTRGRTPHSFNKKKAHKILSGEPWKGNVFYFIYRITREDELSLIYVERKGYEWKVSLRRLCVFIGIVGKGSKSWISFLPTRSEVLCLCMRPFCF